MTSLLLGKSLKEAAMPYVWLDFPTKVIQTILPDISGLLIGLLFRWFPGVIREPGRWIFVVPMALFPALVASSFLVNPHDALIATFGVRGTDYEGLGVIGLIFPAGGICLYSIGIRTGDRHTDPLARVHENEDVLPLAAQESAQPEVEGDEHR